MSALIMCSLPQNLAACAATGRFAGERHYELTIPCSQLLSFTGKVCAQATFRSVRCRATQTQSTQQKSSTAIIQRSDPKGKLNEPKLDDGSGGFPPFRFGKGGGGGGGGGGGNTYFSNFLLFACVLLLDYLKEIEKNLLLQRHHVGDEAGMGQHDNSCAFTLGC